ncbi:unnamed protein product [Arctia plantaginis]|uniref:DNA helicase Pif1-like 2B domain-containing protein n=1 Tax=Arctia plantaginis TaxID=874455 RepID=A0A8S1BM31_ARCPL|nr:unnamed protein product [Arctia plantaginis]
MPRYYTWNASSKNFQRRKQGDAVPGYPDVRSTDALGRMYTVHPKNDATTTNRNLFALSERTILAAKNKDVDDLNYIIQNKIIETMHSFKSIDCVTNEDEATNYPIKFLNSLDVPGLPPHNLRLKVGSVVIMLRNINQPTL